jgi:hypothetical protein
VDAVVPVMGRLYSCSMDASAASPENLIRLLTRLGLAAAYLFTYSNNLMWSHLTPGNPRAWRSCKSRTGGHRRCSGAKQKKHFCSQIASQQVAIHASTWHARASAVKALLPAAGLQVPDPNLPFYASTLWRQPCMDDKAVQMCTNHVGEHKAGLPQLARGVLVYRLRTLSHSARRGWMLSQSWRRKARQRGLITEGFSSIVS